MVVAVRGRLAVDLDGQRAPVILVGNGREQLDVDGVGGVGGDATEGLVEAVVEDAEALARRGVVVEALRHRLHVVVAGRQIPVEPGRVDGGAAGGRHIVVELLGHLLNGVVVGVQIAVEASRVDVQMG